MIFRPFLRPGEAIYAHPGPDQTNTVVSENDAFRLVLQGDGNLVLYNQEGLNPYAQVLWHSHTAGTPASVCYMQTDGNLVVYSSSNAPLWNSNTAGAAGAFLAVQDDGNLVIYAPGNVPIWQTNTITKPGYGTAKY